MEKENITDESGCIIGYFHGMIIENRNQINYWLECKEAMKIIRLFGNLSRNEIIPCFIIEDIIIENKDIIDKNKLYLPNTFKSFLYESVSENNKLEKLGFKNICDSKDDYPIYLRLL